MISMGQRTDIATVFRPNQLAVALTLSLTAHVGLICLLDLRPQYLLAQAPGAIQVRIVPTIAGVGHTEPAVEAVELVPVASGDATPSATTGLTDGRPTSRLRASRIDEARVTNQRQPGDTPLPKMREAAIATPQAAPPSGTSYYADSEVDVTPVALDPIVLPYPSGEGLVAEGGKVTLHLLIDAAGVVKDVVLVETRLPEAFEESARNALLGIRFKPAEKDGQSVACRTLLSIVYAGSAISAASP